MRLSAEVMLDVGDGIVQQMFRPDVPANSYEWRLRVVGSDFRKES